MKKQSLGDNCNDINWHYFLCSPSVNKKRYEKLTYPYSDDETCISIEEFKNRYQTKTFVYEDWLRMVPTQ